MVDCLHKEDIVEIAIQENTNDAWNINSLVLLLKDDCENYYIASMAIDINQWIDGDYSFDTAVKYYKL